jgi:hypothetical protein
VAVSLKLAGPCERLELRLYDADLVCIAVHAAAGRPAGWQRVDLPADWSAAAGRGPRFLRVRAWRGGALAEARVLRVYYRR